MAWQTPPTWADGNALTAAQLLILNGNLLETAVAKATAAGDYFVGTGTNALAKRHIESQAVTTTSTTTSGSYTDNPTGDNGPTVTLTTGTVCLIFHSVQLENSGGGSTYASFEITGATTDPADDNRSIFHQQGATLGGRFGCTTYLAANAGSNTYQMCFRVSTGTGSYDDRRLSVMSF